MVILLMAGCGGPAPTPIPTPTPILTSSPSPTATTATLALRAEYQAITPDGSAPSNADLETVRTIIQHRVDATGVAGPVVETTGLDRIVVELPGVTDPVEFRLLIGSTGHLDFVPIPQGTNPPDEGALIDPSLAPLFSGDQLEPATLAPGFDPTTGEGTVVFELKPAGTAVFAAWSRANVGQYFAMVLDGRVISAPVIRAPIGDGRGQISGNFSAAELLRLVTILKYGPLPLELKESSFDVVIISSTP